MNVQFRNIDAPSAKQEVTFTFEREDLIDDCPDLSWLTDESRYEGEAPADVARYVAEDQERLAAYNRGDWHMLGVRAKATIRVPIGGTSFTYYEMTSAGIWGVESDSGEDYLNEIFEDEKAQLIDAIKAMGAAAASLDQ